MVARDGDRTADAGLFRAPYHLSGLESADEIDAKEVRVVPI
jgi:hypothetical protein